MSDTYFSLKMRADDAGRHISGAERIVRPEQVAAMADILTQRALNHPKGQPSSIHLKVERLQAADIRFIPVLGTDTAPTECPEEADAYMESWLSKLGVRSPSLLIASLRSTTGLRGAQLYSAESCQRIDTTAERGVRVSTFDAVDSSQVDHKEHYREAVTLASKALSAPGIIAELCISDDPDYTTGYIACEGVYRRLPHIKCPGSPEGGRLLVYRGDLADVPATVDYLERRAVLVQL